jgi:hypothetical protein
LPKKGNISKKGNFYFLKRKFPYMVKNGFSKKWTWSGGVPGWGSGSKGPSGTDPPPGLTSVGIFGIEKVKKLFFQIFWTTKIEVFEMASLGRGAARVWLDKGKSRWASTGSSTHLLGQSHPPPSSFPTLFAPRMAAAKITLFNFARVYPEMIVKLIFEMEQNKKGSWRSLFAPRYPKTPVDWVKAVYETDQETYQATVQYAMNDALRAGNTILRAEFKKCCETFAADFAKLPRSYDCGSDYDGSLLRAFADVLSQNISTESEMTYRHIFAVAFLPRFRNPLICGLVYNKAALDGKLHWCDIREMWSLIPLALRSFGFGELAKKFDAAAALPRKGAPRMVEIMM